MAIFDHLWTFGDPQGDVYTYSMRLQPDGSVAGYINQNENGWRFTPAGAIEFINEAGQRTSILHPIGQNHFEGPVDAIPGKSHFLQPTNVRAEEVLWSPEAEAFCERHRIFLAHPYHIFGVYKHGETIRIPRHVVVEPYSSMPIRGFFSAGMCSYARSSMPNTTKVGRYSSIADNISVMGSPHPMDRFTTNPFTYDAKFEELAAIDFPEAKFMVMDYDDDPDPSIVIGHDVWIGEGVLLKRGVTIGDGAVVAARSVVTKDVAPFTVVAGAPAVVKKMRFHDSICEKLEASKWWLYKFTDLPRPWNDVERFLGNLLELEAQGAIKPYTPLPLVLLDELQALTLASG
jgi:acetyltransferase-like isoleucine patch superfamily enzyme